MLQTEPTAAPSIPSTTARRHRGAALVAAMTLGFVVTACAANGTPTDAVTPATTTGPTATATGATGTDATTTATAPDTTTPATTEPIPLSTMEPGDITETVPPAEPVPTVTVALDDAATVTDDVSVMITSIESVETDSALPGEISGPGVAVTVAFDNASPEPLDLSNVVVDLVDAAGTSATPITNGSTPFSGVLEAGQTTTGIYVFTLDESLRRNVTIHLNSPANESTVLFTGDVA